MKIRVRFDDNDSDDDELTNDVGGAAGSNNATFVPKKLCVLKDEKTPYSKCFFLTHKQSVTLAKNLRDDDKKSTNITTYDMERVRPGRKEQHGDAADVRIADEDPTDLFWEYFFTQTITAHVIVRDEFVLRTGRDKRWTAAVVVFAHGLSGKGYDVRVAHSKQMVVFLGGRR